MTSLDQMDTPVPEDSQPNGSSTEDGIPSRSSRSVFLPEDSNSIPIEPQLFCQTPNSVEASSTKTVHKQEDISELPETSVSQSNRSLTKAEILPPSVSQPEDTNSILIEPLCQTPDFNEVSFATTTRKQENILSSIQRELEQKFKRFAQQSQGPICQQIYQKWQQMAKEWLPGILYCYKIPGLPRHNLELEHIYGTLRNNQRRVSGRKETSPLRIFGAGEAMGLMIKTETELLDWCQTVAQDKATYRKQRRLQEEGEEPTRWLRRLHRDPIKAMKQLDEQFYAVLKKLELLPDT